MAQRRFGVKQLLIDGVVYLAKDGCDYSLGGDKQEGMMGLDRFHGVKVQRIIAYLDVTISDGGPGQTDLRKLTSLTDATVMLDLLNGKTIKLGHAYYASEGKVTGAEGAIEARFECDPDNAEEI